MDLRTDRIFATAPAPPDPKRRWKLAGLAAGIVLLTFGLGYLVAVRLLFPPLPEPENGIVVPRLTGLAAEGVERELQPLGLRVGDMTQIAHPDEPEGVIVAQSPLPGQQLRAGGVVRLAVSLGPPRVTVPDVVGFTAERAATALRNLGLEVNQRTEVSERPAGTVLRVTPAPGTIQLLPGRVLLWVSRAPPTPPRPDTLTQDAAQRAIRNNGTDAGY